jgi:hypothetical protein
MTRRPLTAAEAWQSWHVDGELNDGHTVAETLAFVNATEDVAEQRALPAAYVPGDHEPRWRTRINRWLRR